jgi:hypothetical protein
VPSAFPLSYRVERLALEVRANESGHRVSQESLSKIMSWLRQCIRMPPMVVWMVLSAVFFLAGAAHTSMAGGTMLAKIGVLGAIAAVAVIAAFSG